MLKNIFLSSSGESTSRSICLIADKAFLRSVYSSLKGLDPNHAISDDISGETHDPALAMHDETVMEVSLLDTGSDTGRCFVEHQYTYTRKYRHKVINILLLPSAEMEEDSSDIVAPSKSALSGLMKRFDNEKRGLLRLREGCGARTVLADHGVASQATVSYLLEETDAAFLPIFAPLESSLLVVRHISGQPAGYRMVIIAPHPVLNEVSRLLLGVDNSASAAYDENTVLLLHHFMPASTFNGFDLTTSVLQNLNSSQLALYN